MKSHGVRKFKNLFVVGVSLIFTLTLSRVDSFHAFLLNLGGLGYLGAFVAGVLFVSTFTVATGSLVLLILAEKLSPLELGLIAGLGAVVGDLAIFKFVKDGLAAEIELVYDQIDDDHHLKKLFHSKYFSWTLPIIGAVIIISPLPDELGVSLLGISKMGTYRFAFMSYLLNSIGIFLVISLSALIKP